ncbi:hypothetical protein LJC45_04805 [Alistipes sp. OttesenSCG-928-B03]|nr:hypothetical protein [Alistipes sp. OttesenSCG-928-B03]
MAPDRKKYKIRIVFGLSNINADFLQLILCMLVGHYIIDNPLYGGALFLFTNIWTLYFQSNLRHIKFRGNSRMSVAMWVFLTASVLAALALVFFFPIVTGSVAVNYVSFFVMMLTARSVITYWVNKTYNRQKTADRVYKALFQLLFIAACSAFAAMLMQGPAMWVTIGGAAVTGFLLSFQSSTLVSLGKYVGKMNRDKMADIFSYAMFSNMALYAQIAFSLGALMYICYISFGGGAFSVWNYLAMGGWILVVLIAFELFTWLVNRAGWVLSLNLFVVGVAMWAIGSVQVYNADNLLRLWMWTLFWGFGLAATTAVTNRYNADQKMVARLAGRRISDRDLYFRNLLTQAISVILSNAIMLCIVTIWTFWIPTFTDTQLPGSFREVMIQLPVVFMAVSLVFALKQPLDRRSRQKLVNYSKGINANEPTKESLNARLVKKSRVRFGVKIIAAVFRPFLRLRVSGGENMAYRDFPSVFVCNHGVIYGPVAAVIYLPTYFRPWVDKKMCDRDLCAREIYARHIRKLPLPEKTGRALSRFVARPVTWAIGSFNPIAVEKNSLRNVMSTFGATVDVLREGDNVLIFPEKPKKRRRGGEADIKHETDTVGTLYTGFANIGRLYYDATGKALRFYPIYADRRRHTFRIGEPTLFDPAVDPREEKQRIADDLHRKMLALKSPE